MSRDLSVPPPDVSPFATAFGLVRAQGVFRPRFEAPTSVLAVRVHDSLLDPARHRCLPAAFALRLALMQIVFLLPVPAQTADLEFIRGDTNADRTINVSDAIMLLNYLSLGDPAFLSCDDAADANNSGALDYADASYLLNYLSLGGSPPPDPFPACGTDDGSDSLTCNVYICPDLVCGNDVSCTSPTALTRCVTKLPFDPCSATPDGPVYSSNCLETRCFIGQIRKCTGLPSGEYVASIAADDIADVWVDSTRIWFSTPSGLFDHYRTDYYGSPEWTDCSAPAPINLSALIVDSDWHTIKIRYTNLFNEYPFLNHESGGFLWDGLTLRLGAGWETRDDESTSPFLLCEDIPQVKRVWHGCTAPTTLDIVRTGQGDALFLPELSNSLPLSSSPSGYSDVDILGISVSGTLNDLTLRHTWDENLNRTFTVMTASVTGAPCAGFDDRNVFPPWLVVPIDGSNTASVLLRPTGVATAFPFGVGCTDLIATNTPVIPTSDAFTLEVFGLAKGETDVLLVRGDGETIEFCAALARASVKQRRTMLTSIHFIHSATKSALPAGTTHPAAAVELIEYLNSIWLPQANVEFVLQNSDDLFDSEGLLDDSIVPNFMPSTTFFERFDNFQLEHRNPVVDWNLFLIPVLLESTPIFGDPQEALGITVTVVQPPLTLMRSNLPNLPHDWVLTIAAHEAGHALGLLSPPDADYDDPDRSDEIMFRHATGNSSCIVRKFQADIVND